MALNQSQLESDLYDLFFGMRPSSMADSATEYFCRQASDIVSAYANSGQVDTTDTGTISAGVFTGVGIGNMNSVADVCYNILYPVCKSMEGDTSKDDRYFADGWAEAIDTMCTQANIILTMVTGSVLTPSGSTSAASGTGIGDFTSDEPTLADNFYDTFMAMRPSSMADGADRYLAERLAQDITTYITSGIVNTIDQEALIGAVGVGAIS